MLRESFVHIFVGVGRRNELMGLDSIEVVDFELLGVWMFPLFQFKMYIFFSRVFGWAIF